MNRNILIIGMGRSGKRHARLLTSMGITTGILDINPINYDEIDYIYGDHRPPIYNNFNEVIRDNVWDVAVIATPPQFHLEYIRRCLENSMWVSCEKPLSGFGQIHDAELMIQDKLPLERVQVQYNYRFNPSLQQLNGEVISDAWQFVATQYRPELPSWGLLLDHLSHDIDIVRWVSKKNFTIQECIHEVREDVYEQYIIHGKTKYGVPIYIVDGVKFIDKNHPRFARLISPHGYADATPDPQMFSNMWNSFFGNYRVGLPQYPSFQDALETQKILQEAHEKTSTVTL